MKTILLVLLITFLPKPTLNVDGKWHGLLKCDQGDFNLKYNFVTKDKILTGTVETPYGVATIEDGKIKNDSLFFYIDVKHLEIDHACKVYSDHIDVNVSHEDIGYSFKLSKD